MKTFALFLLLGATVLAGPAWAQSRTPGTVFKDCAECPPMIILPTGVFLMGSEEAETRREGISDKEGATERPRHQVRIGSFALGTHEVTRGQFAAFVKATGYAPAMGCHVWNGKAVAFDPGKNWLDPGFAQSDAHPVVCVSWEDATEYVDWLSSRGPGRLRNSRFGFRLPSEAEWEYAARAGTTTARYWGDDGHASCAFANTADLAVQSRLPGAGNWPVAKCDDKFVFTAPVGSFRPNAFGLFDMIGNVWEWTQDCGSDDYRGAPNDGSADESIMCDRQRIKRGGSWGSGPFIARAADRAVLEETKRYAFGGFRIARFLTRDGN